ncbi:MAG: SDR family oxidoreductase [Bacteroidetes bacterium]|nr:SDR family oxidoreductase [Bacteroidota bacterium]
MSGKKILVTGGAGFIGSNLCEDLLKYDNQVICLDNLSTGHSSNLKEITNHPNFQFVEGDIANMDVCQTVCKDIDLVLHQAALCSVPRSIDHPLATHQANINGFLNILIASRDNKVGRVIYAASSSAYGDSEILPKVEGQEGEPLSPYALTKTVNEMYAKVFSKNYNIETIGLRYFNVFGPKQDPNGAYAAVVPKFVDQFLKNQSPTINGDGSFSRDFTFIENVIQMIHLAGTSTNPKAIGEVFNTAAGLRTTLLELTQAIQESIASFDPNYSFLEINHGPERKGDIPHSWASIEKAKSILNYNPNTNLKDQINTTVKSYLNSKKES